MNQEARKRPEPPKRQETRKKEEPRRKQEPRRRQEPQKKKEKPVKSPEKKPFFQRKSGSEPFQWKQASRTMLFWVLFILVAVSVTRFLGSTPSDEKEVTYSQYRLLLKNQQIQSAVIVDREFHGVLTEPYPFPEGEGFREFQKIVLNLGPIDADTKKEWE